MARTKQTARKSAQLKDSKEAKRPPAAERAVALRSTTIYEHFQAYKLRWPKCRMPIAADIMCCILRRRFNESRYACDEHGNLVTRSQREQHNVIMCTSCATTEQCSFTLLTSQNPFILPETEKLTLKCPFADCSTKSFIWCGGLTLAQAYKAHHTNRHAVVDNE